VLALFYNLLYSNRMSEEREDKIGGFHLAKGSSKLGCSITLWQVKRLVRFLGRVYGALRQP
jgi:hypothetical protein